MDQISTIGRPIDLDHPTNRAIAVLTGVVALVGALFQWVAGVGLVTGGLQGLAAGVSVFIAWVVCRELDPDHERSAFFAAGLAFLGLFWGLPNLLVLFWIVLVVRVINRTPGRPATVLDGLAVLGLSGWLVWDRGNWIYGAAAGVALALDGVLVEPNRKQLGFAAVAFLATGVWVGLDGTWWGDGAWSTASILTMGMMVALFAPVIVQSRQVHTVGDLTNERLAGTRVQMAQLFALSMGMLIGVWNGAPGMTMVMPLWAAVVGAAGYSLLIGPLLARFLVTGREE